MSAKPHNFEENGFPWSLRSRLAERGPMRGSAVSSGTTILETSPLLLPEQLQQSRRQLCPSPSSLLLLGSGSLALGGFARKRLIARFN
jgi:hypothetical protein